MLAGRESRTNAALVHAIAEVTRSLLRSTPAPRGMPYFGLDMAVHEPHMLDEFCRQGIFRKYERCSFAVVTRFLDDFDLSHGLLPSMRSRKSSIFSAISAPESS